MEAVSHLEFLTFEILTLHTLCSRNLHVHAKFHPDQLKDRRDIANYQLSIWRTSAMLNFRNVQITTFSAVYSHNVHVYGGHAKFRRDRLNGCGGIVNFRFSIWRMSAILICFAGI